MKSLSPAEFSTLAPESSRCVHAYMYIYMHACLHVYLSLCVCAIILLAFLLGMYLSWTSLNQAVCWKYQGTEWTCPHSPEWKTDIKWVIIPWLIIARDCALKREARTLWENRKWSTETKPRMEVWHWHLALANLPEICVSGSTQPCLQKECSLILPYGKALVVPSRGSWPDGRLLLLLSLEGISLMKELLLKLLAYVTERTSAQGWLRGRSWS